METSTTERSSIKNNGKNPLAITEFVSKNIVAIMIGVIALSSVYYFIVRPEIEQKTYTDCVSHYNARMVIVPQFQALINDCVKSGGKRWTTIEGHTYGYGSP